MTDWADINRLPGGKNARTIIDPPLLQQNVLHQFNNKFFILGAARQFFMDKPYGNGTYRGARQQHCHHSPQKQGTRFSKTTFLVGRQ